MPEDALGRALRHTTEGAASGRRRGLWRRPAYGARIRHAGPVTDPLAELVEVQAGLVARRQLIALGLDSDRVRNQVAAGRWCMRTPRVIGTTTGPLSPEQRRWLAVLHAGPREMLGGLSAAELHGLVGWPREDITVLVDDELAFEPVEGVRFFRSRRPFDLLRHPGPGIARARLEPAVLLFAAYDAAPRTAHGCLAATVQQRLTSADRLAEWVEQLRPLRRAKSFRAALVDVGAGAHSAAELDVRRMCRRRGLALPSSQRTRTDRAGRRRWTDCEWRLPGGLTLILEVDGAFHLDVAQYADDIRRQRALTTPTRLVVRCTADELRHDDATIADDLAALGVPRLTPGSRAS